VMLMGGMMRSGAGGGFRHLCFPFFKFHSVGRQTVRPSRCLR
jgi:hypothetical protein